MADRARILAVDDELGPRESLRMILKPSYDVHTVADGMAALKFLEKNSVDLITLDLKMPGLSGMEVLEEIRKSHPDVMVIIVTGYGTFKSVVEAIHLNVFDYISKPFNIPEIISVVERCLEMRNTKRALRDVFREIAGLSHVDASESHRVKVAERIRKSFSDSGCFHTGSKDVPIVEFLRTVSKGIERKDTYTAGHSERVSHYADLAAQKLGLPQPLREEIQIASYLHDIGKMCISSRFMNGEGKLSSTDWAILKRHPIESVELIRPLNLADSVVSAIRHHHERFDGTGYPDGIAGSDIPVAARLISIGNTYDALTLERPYRNAMNAVGARSEIQKYAGTYFDPDLVRTFLNALKEKKNPSRSEDVNQESDR